jgi:hypothetical protein
VPRIADFSLRSILLTLSLVAPLVAQQTPAEAPSSQQPQVKVNMLNVCSPSQDEQKEIAAALGRIPKQPLFGSDFEVSRGRSTLTEMPTALQLRQPGHVAGEPSVANYVRIRREFSVQAMFSLVQYSFSNDGQMMVETLVLHVRDPKDLIQVSLEDSASAVTSAEAMLGSNTPVSHMRLERFGKPSIALARCPATEGSTAVDQSAYEPLFHRASEILGDYRALLGVKAIIPEELAKISGSAKPKSAASAAKTGSTSKMRRSPAPQK